MFVSGGPYWSDQVSDNLAGFLQLVSDHESHEVTHRVTDDNVRTVEMDTANGSDVVVGHLHGEADGTEVLFIDGMHLDP